VDEVPIKELEKKAEVSETTLTPPRDGNREPSPGFTSKKTESTTTFDTLKTSELFLSFAHTNKYAMHPTSFGYA